MHRLLQPMIFRRRLAVAALAFHPFLPEGEAGQAAPPGVEATLAIVNARIWTGDRIAAVGSDAEIRAVLTPSTRVIAARDRTVLPGLIDAHFHVLDLAEPEPPLSLRFVASRREFVRLVARAAADAPPGSWVLGVGWDERKWGGALPSKEWIDPVTPRNPVWLTRALGGAGLANSLALAAAGVTGSPAKPQPAGVVRDRAGAPTGLIRGEPMRLIDAVLLAPDRQRAEGDAVRVMPSLLRMGVTSVPSCSGMSTPGRRRARRRRGTCSPAATCSRRGCGSCSARMRSRPPLSCPRFGRSRSRCSARGSDAAFAEFAEAEKGTIEPGKLADMVVLDRDLFASGVAALHATEVAVTVVGGRVAYQQ